MGGKLRGGGASEYNGSSWKTFFCPEDKIRDDRAARLSYAAAGTWSIERNGQHIKTTVVKIPSRAYLIFDSDFNNDSGLERYAHSRTDYSFSGGEVFATEHKHVGKVHSLQANILYLDGHAATKRNWKGLNTDSRMYSDYLLAEQNGTRSWGNIGAMDY